MSEDNLEQVQAVAAPATTQAPSGHIDPEEYNRLLEENSRYAQAFDRLTPQTERISRLMNDPDAAAVFDNALQALEDMKRRQEPQVPEELKPIVTKLSRLEKLADEYEKQQKDLQEAPQRELQTKWQNWMTDSGNEKFYRKLATDHPDLKQRDLQYLAQVAAEQNFVPLETVWNEQSWRFVPPTRSAPPPSLRANAGDVGVPDSPNAQAPEKSARDRVIELERARRAIA